MITQTWLPRLGFGLSAFPLYAYGGELIERDGALATDVACCCQEGSFCSPCTQCIRGAWVTIPAFTVADTTSFTCQCASVAGTYYVPIGPAQIACTPSEPYNPSCMPTNSFASGECTWANRPPFYSCQGCMEVYWENIPGCDDTSPGNCVFTIGGAQAWKIRGAIGWGIHSIKEGGFWRFRSYITYLDVGFYGAWIRDFTSALTGETADCSQHNADLTVQCGGDPCDPGATASLLLDFGTCP